MINLMGKQIEGAIFDLDGVIVDTAKYHFIAWKELANTLGFDFTEKDNERLKGVSRSRSLEILLEIGNLSLTPEQFQIALISKNTRYVQLVSKMDASEILPGVLDFLSFLNVKGIRTALGSASKNAPLILKRVGLTGAFDAIVDGNMASKAKPDPQVFTLGAKMIGLDSSKCMVFEDSEAGLEAAKKGNMLAIGIGSPENLHSADLLVQNFEQLLKIITR